VCVGCEAKKKKMMMKKEALPQQNPHQQQPSQTQTHASNGGRPEEDEMEVGR